MHMYVCAYSKCIFTIRIYVCAYSKCIPFASKYSHYLIFNRWANSSTYVNTYVCYEYTKHDSERLPNLYIDLFGSSVTSPYPCRRRVTRYVIAASLAVVSRRP